MSVKKSKSKSKSNRHQDSKQYGGGSTGFANLWYSVTPNNLHMLNKYTSDNLNNTPMFNPLKSDTTFATPTSGIIPTGIYLGNKITTNYQPSQPLYLTGGGGSMTQKTNDDDDWYEFSRLYSKQYKMSHQSAINSKECQQLYKTWQKYN